MSFLEKIRRFFKEERLEETKIEKISFGQLSLKLNEKLKESAEKKEKVKKDVTEKIMQFERELSESIKILEKIDISGKKEHEKIKLVVVENLGLYVGYLKKLITDLKAKENLDAEELIKKIFSLLNEFNRISYVAFEKATILIGKELDNARKAIKEFAKEINKIAEDNKTLFDEIATIKQLNSLLQELNYNEIYLKELETRIEDSTSEVNKTKEESEKIKKKIQEIKSSDNYKKDAEKKEEYSKKLQEMERDIQLIKQKIDFKLLAKHFHHDKKKSQTVRNYSDNFKFTVENDENLEIMTLVKEAQNVELPSLKEIRNKIIELKEPPITKSDEEISALENELRKLDSRISSLNVDVENELRKKEKLTAKGEKIVQEIKEIVKNSFVNWEVK